ncbi:LTA synthase family protein [Erythrobacter litoralis]|uniref:Putative sulfatase n=1 Tax=Erythrobacter litoralis (strain HTCC2594) TaxID=314225 RepID=Q2N729_ERYLH|nr:sulfatase-like hydrolase/transferase [Erythrobacter litoralis]ABC64512.1 putative sulfatase [Erythrobacter litoralis HTCC2594]
MLSTALKRLLNPMLFVPLAIALVSLVELAIADRKYGVFTGGFGQSTAVDTVGELALFLAGFAIAQLAAGLVAWRLAAWLARKSGTPVAMVHFAFLYGGLSLLALTLQYQLHSYFSDAVSFALLTQLGGGSATDALLFAKNEIALGLAGFAGFALAWWLAVKLVRRLTRSEDVSTPTGPAWRWIAAAWTGLLIAIIAIPRTGSDSARGLERVLVWNGVSRAAAQATDFDGDGYGLAGRQLDRHPFDAARHPLALDIPGNGIDEDGFGGDLELVSIPQTAPDTTLTGAKPHVIIVVFESTRFDVIGKRIDGQPVAPNLEALAVQGSAIVPTYSHVGFTTESLKSLFGGALTVEPGAPSLFRDFKRSGYGIGVFSGQPEDFGGISEAVGMRDSADIFVDAEKLKDQRAFSFAAQGSLLVDEGIILDQFDKALGDAQDWQQPQFVYLNFQSPHFPYHQPAIGERFARPPVTRGEINAGNAAQVQQTYWNAVAHTDAALGRLIAKLKEVGAWDNTLMLVTGDHGEALFERGFLGHGHVINRLQNGTFLVSNRPLDGVEAPIAQSDIRRILLGQLGADQPAAERHAPFMHIGPLDAPAKIGMVDSGYGIVSLRFDRSEACFEREDRCFAYDGLEGARHAAIDRLVARWGSERWARRQR